MQLVWFLEILRFKDLFQKIKAQKETKTKNLTRQLEKLENYFYMNILKERRREIIKIKAQIDKIQNIAITERVVKARYFLKD